MDIKAPTSEQCNANQKVFEEGGKVGFAIWYPQMGGYTGKAVAIMDQGGNDCIDVLVWHDGEFPFGEGEPREIHHCDPQQFIEFGETLAKLNTGATSPAP